ncbi:uncharacterized protein JN550_001348 [Neoarthrinium moseri]|uniref:uncharacterized protein n=1 Tax=Neoarthrinium moseri TaxID=1658444 RepID=UPI001FDB2171|nr:uncharacterized protein JN550_001348 [Neoarthrinium moseri]KAI1877276.1 hypothetical protein JN550_001348 [Neoarthrinium moseri]
MPPKRKAARASLGVSTPKTPTPMHEDSMDIDTPQASDTPRAADTPTVGKPNQPSAEELLGNIWTDDQESSLYKGIIRWKPAGMHKHFRMLAISEHLRNHGINPDVETHTRIPGIWAKLRTLYSLDLIDERENYDDDVDKYKEFGLPNTEYWDMMFARRLPENPSEAPSSPPEMDLDDHSTRGAAGPPSVSGGERGTKRKRGGANAADVASVAGSTARTRGSTVEDTEEDTPLASSPVAKSARGARSRKRAAAKAKAESTEPEPTEENDEEDGNQGGGEEGAEEEAEDEDEDEEREEEEESDAEAEAEAEAEDTAAKSTRGSTKATGRTTRARANTRKGRK